MICPVCEKNGLKSKVYSNGCMKTLMGYTPYYDEEGKHHDHDGNRVTSYFECSNKHRFLTISHGSCWCGWTGGETKTEIIEDE